MQFMINTVKVTSIGYVLSWNAQVNYQTDLLGSGKIVFIWFSPLGWVLPSIDPTGSMIVNIGSYNFFLPSGWK